MTSSMAAQVASEQIRWWLGRGITAKEAWQALGRPGRGGWREVRLFIERWMVAHG